MYHTMSFWIEQKTGPHHLILSEGTILTGPYVVDVQRYKRRHAQHPPEQQWPHTTERRDLQSGKIPVSGAEMCGRRPAPGNFGSIIKEEEESVLIEIE